MTTAQLDAHLIVHGSDLCLIKKNDPESDGSDDCDLCVNLAQALHEAVEDEREACAKLCEEIGGELGGSRTDPSDNDICFSVADCIRKRSQP